MERRQLIDARLVDLAHVAASSPPWRQRRKIDARFALDNDHDALVRLLMTVPAEIAGGGFNHHFGEHPGRSETVAGTLIPCFVFHVPDTGLVAEADEDEMREGATTGFDRTPAPSSLRALRR